MNCDQNGLRRRNEDVIDIRHQEAKDAGFLFIFFGLNLPKVGLRLERFQFQLQQLALVVHFDGEVANRFVTCDPPKFWRPTEPIHRLLWQVEGFSFHHLLLHQQVGRPYKEQILLV